MKVVEAEYVGVMFKRKDVGSALPNQKMLRYEETKDKTTPSEFQRVLTLSKGMTLFLCSASASAFPILSITNTSISNSPTSTKA